MPINRNQQHYIIMTVIYDELNDFVLGGGKTFRDATELTSELCEMPYEEVDDYIKDSIGLALQNYGKIVAAFTPYLKNWVWDRLPLLTQAILMMSYTHFYLVEKVAKAVVINVAVELAKKYIDSKQSKFINAILNEVLK